MGSTVFTHTKATYCLLIIFFTACSSEEQSVVCYKCNSLFDPACGDPFEKFSIGSINCSWIKTPDYLQGYKPSFCRKTVQTVQGKTSIVRGCGYVKNSHYDGRCVRKTGTHDVIVRYCTCSSSLCNGTPSPIRLSNFAFFVGLLNFVYLCRVV